MIQSFVELPADQQARIAALVLVVVSWAIAKLIALIPFLSFLEQFREPLALALAAELINLIQNGIPDAFGGIAVAAVQLLLELAALVIVFVKLRERGVKIRGKALF